jgi:malate dehydrogenase (oxaloacetate-decarboxylating)(NADP+)
MRKSPIIFAMANPIPEIPYELAKHSRPDAIVATGRSDYPNQINNLLGFPYIFRGALDVRASRITDEMKMSASMALARLAKLPVPPQVLKAYEISSLEFGLDYIIPKPLDPRVYVEESLAVAQCAIDQKIARFVLDTGLYRQSLIDKVISKYPGIY